jgi:hypothetical protein
MTGEAMVRLVQLMERNRQVAHHPRRAGAGERSDGAGASATIREPALWTDFGHRFELLATRLKPALRAHAIIRLAPFIQHCSLPELAGEGPFGGRIMSHDYVEAALMRRAGWQV